MNDQMSWHQSLVKKFSSSNHFKLMNQLRSEVIKYPIIRKHKSTSELGINKTLESNSNLNYKNNNNLLPSKTSNNINENKSSHSTISFNNSKNFSIYNNNANDSSKEIDEIILSDEIQSNIDSSTPTFKDRLNKIDMK